MGLYLGLAIAVVAGLLGAGLGSWWARRPGTEGLSQRRTVEPSKASSRRDVSLHTDARVVRAVTDLELGVVVTDADGGEVFRNRSAEQYATGRHGNALVGAALERVIDGARVGLSLEESVDLYGPPARNLQVQASPLMVESRIDGVVAAIEDVTEARYNDRVRSDFVANVSHELRTPVGAMSILAETLVDSEDVAVKTRMAKRIQSECLRLSETLEDLLVLSRLESGPTSEPETLDMQSAVTMAVERTSAAARRRGVDVVVSKETNGPVLVDGDHSQLTSAVANLLDNAIKYSDEGRGIKISIGTESTALGSRGAMATVSVIDGGIGIPEADRKRIFERFYRVDSARSRETGGTGLGLAIVRHAMINHGGSVEVVSKEGAGTTFTLSIPLSPTQLQTDSSFGEANAEDVGIRDHRTIEDSEA